MKRLFKNLLLFSAISVTTLPIVCCQKPQNETKTIEITSQIDDLTIMENETHLSKPIQAKCYGSDKKEKTLDIQFKLSTEDDEELPGWISMTSNNEIKLSEGKDVGTYNFILTAYNEKEGIYSTSKMFKVNVIQERHIIPDQITLEFESEKYCMYGEQTKLPIKVIPSKEGIDEKYLIKTCNFDVNFELEEIKDLKGEKLIKLSDSNIDPDLEVSEYTDETFCGKYSVNITASLLDDPTITTSKKIDINIDNIYCYYDEINEHTYTRNSADDTWELSLIKEGAKSLKNVASFIQNKPVTKVAKNLCNKSNVTKLFEIILPDSIETIGESAFENQTRLCFLEMSGVKYVENNAFKGDTILEYDNTKNEPNLVVVGDSAFEGCKNLQFNSRKDIQWIGDFAFKDAGLRNFWCGTKVRYIGQESFAENPSLKTFKIETATPPLLGGANFAKSDSLEKIYVPIDFLDDYKVDNCWKEYSQKLEGIYI